MPSKSFKLSARISSSSPNAIRPILNQLFKNGSIKQEKEEFVVDAVINGTSAKDLNRTLLSTLRRAEKKTRLRATWTHSGTTERYFDYVMKNREEKTS